MYFYICHKCFGQLNIRINELSNIVIIYCEKCKTEPVGLNIDDFMKKNNKNQQFFSCKNCHNPLNFNIKEKKFECSCFYNLSGLLKNKSFKIKKNIDENISIPIFLKDCFWEHHNNFHKYYLNYSKIGLCPTCFDEKMQNDYFIDKFNDDNINELIAQKSAQLKTEKEHINNIQRKFYECIND